MPRPTQIQKTQRLQIDPRDTFDFTTPNLGVEARPIDSYVAPAKDSKATQLATALGLLQDSAKSFVQYKDQRNQIDLEKGADARRRGDAEDKGKGWAFIRGWEQLDGEIKAGDFKVDAQKWLEDHKNDDPDTFNTGWHEFSTGYLGEAGATDNTLRGFYPKALDVEEAVKSSYQTYQQKLIQDQIDTKAGTLARQNVEDVILPALGVTDMNSFLTNPQDWYTKYYLNGDSLATTLAPKLREVGTNLIAKLKALNLSTPDASKIYLETIGNMAATYGIPELMDYALIKDKDGIAIADNPELAKDAYNYKEMAEHQKDQIYSTMRAQLNQQQKEQSQLAANSFYYRIFSLDPSSQAFAQDTAQLRTELSSQDNMKLLGEHYESVLNQLEEITKRQGAPQYSTRSVQERLWPKEVNGTLTWKDLSEAMPYLCDSDIDHYVNAIQEEIEKAKKKAKGSGDGYGDEKGDWLTHKKDLGDRFSLFIQNYSKMDPILGELGAANKGQANSYLMNKFYAFQKTHGGREPDGNEFQEMIDDTLKRCSPSFVKSKDNHDDTNHNNKDEGSGHQKHQPKEDHKKEHGKVIKKEKNQKTGKIRYTYEDGHIEYANQ